MSDERARIFRMVETADNFVKYAGPGHEARAAKRARKRYEKALDVARGGDDAEMINQIELRLQDLERRATMPPGERVRDAIDDRSSVLISEPPDNGDDRVPPGQSVKRGWPVLHEGPIPRFDPEVWRLTVRGAVGRGLELTYDELKALPNVEMKSDFHCVTGWSKLDNQWRGVQTATLLQRSDPWPDATHVTVHAEFGYTANLPLDVLMEPESLVAWGHNGEALVPKHGYPLRLVVPRLYAWKSVKWVRSFELLTEDRRGFWEVRGYHNRADPWLEERYSYQER